MDTTSSTMTNETDMSEGHPRRWVVLWIMCLSLVLVVVSVSSLNVAIPAIQRSLEATGSELQWIIDSYALAFAGLLLPAGALGDRYGRRGALLFGLAIFAVASIGGLFSSSPEQLIGWRALTGAGAAFIMPATLSIVTTVFPRSERGRAIAIWAGFAGAGGAVGLIMSGLLLERFWWGSILLINVPIVIALAIGTLTLVPSSRDESEASLDPTGAVLSIVGLAALVFAIIEGPEAGWTDPLTLTAVVVAVVAVGLFLVWELRITNPMLDPRFFKDRQFSLGSLTITLAFFGIFGMFFVVTQYFQFVQGLSPLQAGVRILPYALVLLVAAPRSARVVERLGGRVVVVIGSVAAAVGFGLLALSDPSTPYLQTAVALVVVAAGVGFLMPPSTSAIVTSLPADKAGVGSAVNDLTREVGGLIGIAVVGSLVALGYRSSVSEVTADLPDDVVHAAEDSIGGLQTVAADLPAEAAGQLLDAGADAFTHGMRWGMGAAAGTMLVSAVLVAILLPRGTTSTRSQGEGS
ncbi:MAG: DHA2 family efflux MFS transporter permease subunit [Microthrixaceae bacterium]